MEENEKIEISPEELVPKEETEEEKKQKFLERKVEISKRYVKPHAKVSRQVTQEDIERVIEEGKLMTELCTVGNGIYTDAYAIAHPQIDDQDPLAFYVNVFGQTIINPVITRHSNYVVDKKEGCLSYPEEPMVVVKRWHKCEYDYQTLIWEGDDDNKKVLLSPVMHEKVSGTAAQIAQHEIDHLNGIYIYPINGTPVEITYVEPEAQTYPQENLQQN